ncbi:MAG: chemotaxis response regulator protein-glutamate methylesterase [Deltaproteobacteria bacterium]|nr:chemotaxis response regulator protein-glutamate methylesterase [Deltaproteobacteria bacterium]
MKDDSLLRVLVVDDTIVYRKIVSDILEELPGVEVVGVAHNGKIAMSKIASLKPDVLTLDIEMPEMNGLEVLAHMRTEAPDVGAIVLSTLTQKGGDLTMKALELGAFDFITKPETDSMAESREQVKGAIAPMLQAFSRRREVQKILRGKLRAPTAPVGAAGSVHGSEAMGQHIATLSERRHKKSEIVAIGVSTGGPNALAQMLPRLPADINVPILIVQHMPPLFTASLAKSLDAKCAITVKEADDGEAIAPNKALIAPGGKQMKVVAGLDGSTRIVRVTDDPPENSCKPSVDYLFRSVASHYVGRATGVIMTGMGADGAKGMALMKKNGAVTIAQDEATCVVYGMPKEAVEAKAVDVIAPLGKIAEEISRTVQ